MCKTHIHWARLGKDSEMGSPNAISFNTFLPASFLPSEVTASRGHCLQEASEAPPGLLCSWLCPCIICNTHHFALQLFALLCMCPPPNRTLSISIPLFSQHLVQCLTSNSGWQVTLIRWLCLSSGKASWGRGYLNGILSKGRSASRDGRNSMVNV